MPKESMAKAGATALPFHWLATGLVLEKPVSVFHTQEEADHGGNGHQAANQEEVDKKRSTK